MTLTPAQSRRSPWRSRKAPAAAPATIRPASEADEAAIVELVYGDPDAELRGLLGDDALAREFSLSFGRLLTRRERAWERMQLAECDGRAVGVLFWSHGGSSRIPVDPNVIIEVFKILGFQRVLKMRRYNKLRRKISPTRPQDSLHIAELQVAGDFRNRGIGRQLLAHTEGMAVDMGCPRLSLITAATNPARRLYTRCGYRVTEELTDPDYEQLCGVPGRVLMVKDLPPR